MIEAPTTLKNALPRKTGGGHWRNVAERESPSGSAFAPASQDAGSWRGNATGEFLERGGRTLVRRSVRSYQYCGFCRQIFTGLRMQVLGIMVESLEV